MLEFLKPKMNLLSDTDKIRFVYFLLMLQVHDHYVVDNVHNPFLNYRNIEYIHSVIDKCEML